MKIESEQQAENPIIYKMMDGTEITIGKNVADFWERILSLPVIYRVQLLGLTEENVEDFLSAKRIGLSLMISEFLKKKWKWRESGENVVLDDMLEFEFPHLGKLKQIKKDIKQNKLSIKMLQELHDFFNNEEKIYL